jgi:hypothetical protein
MDHKKPSGKTLGFFVVGSRDFLPDFCQKKTPPVWTGGVNRNRNVWRELLATIIAFDCCVFVTAGAEGGFLPVSG